MFYHSNDRSRLASPNRPCGLGAGRGYTLIELVVATAIASVLVVGMSSALLLSSQALTLNDGPAGDRIEASRALAQIAADLEHANYFSERSATVLEFTVPDRDANGVAETLRYAWSGVSGEALTYQVNGSSPETLIANVTNLNFDSFERTYPAAEITNADEIGVNFRGYAFARSANSTTYLQVAPPEGTNSGDLLIAAVVTDGNNKSSLTGPAGWTALSIEEQWYAVTLGIWWKLAEEDEPATYAWTWGNSEPSVAWTMRFTNHDPSNPINNYAVYGHSSNSPIAPSTNSTVKNSLVLRLGAFDDSDISQGNPGVAAHYGMLMDRSYDTLTFTGPTSGGAAYVTRSKAGNVSSATFSLNEYEEYRTATIVIAPAVPEDGD